MDLYSINYLHFGKPKKWYCIPASHSEQFERTILSLLPPQQCKQFLRHKNTLVQPSVLRRRGVPVFTAIQEEGEFMISFPNSYHCGFNFGFNCAGKLVSIIIHQYVESVNFATRSWIPYGLKAKVCTCQSDVFRMNVQDFIELVKQKFPNEEIPTEIQSAKKRKTGNKQSPNKKVKEMQIEKFEDCKMRWGKIQQQLSEMYNALHLSHPELQR
jgi:hypothetical protein